MKRILTTIIKDWHIDKIVLDKRGVSEKMRIRLWIKRKNMIYRHQFLSGIVKQPITKIVILIEF